MNMFEDGIYLVFSGDITLKKDLGLLRIKGNIKIDIESNIDIRTNKKSENINKGQVKLIVNGYIRTGDDANTEDHYLLQNNTASEELQNRNTGFNEFQSTEVCEPKSIICANCDANNCEINITNSKEEIVYNQSFNLLQNYIYIKLPIDDLPIGVYTLSLKLKDKCLANRFVKLG